MKCFGLLQFDSQGLLKSLGIFTIVANKEIIWPSTIW